MGIKLEGVIRPFTAGDVFTAQLLPPVQPNSEAKPNIVRNYGNAITLQLKGIGITNLFGGVKMKETSRTTKTVRVTNPTDSSQYVDVEKILSLTMQDESKQFHSFNFNE